MTSNLLLWAPGMRFVLNGPAIRWQESSSARYWSTTLRCCKAQSKFFCWWQGTFRVIKANSESTADPHDKESDQWFHRDYLQVRCSNDVTLMGWLYVLPLVVPSLWLLLISCVCSTGATICYTAGAVGKVCHHQGWKKCHNGLDSANSTEPWNALC